MISVGNRDGRKREGLEGRSKMEGVELEEGEAFSYREDDDRSIDPDVTFSYIDKKLQDVLGHFKKDFEAGLSAENLGAKFGGYGSFLPMYQRSPVSSHSKSPPKIQSFYTLTSPINLPVEGGHQNCSAQSELSHHTKRGTSIAGSESSQIYKAPSHNDSVRRVSTRYMQSVENFTPKSSAAERSANLPDQKTLKVRIKVGSDNLSTKNNAAIYSGLGLDVSPSSSFDDSPAKSPGSSHGITDASDESPTLILEIMTSFPIDGGHLLSPLPDGLIQLSNKEKLPQYSSTLPTSKISGGSIIQGVYHPVKGMNKISEEGMKTTEKMELPVELRRGCAEESSENLDLLTKKEPDFDTSASHGLISNALKLPLLSNSPVTAVTSHGASPASCLMSKAGKRGALNENSSTASPKEKSFGPPSSDNNGRNQIPNGKAFSAGKHTKSRKLHSSDAPSRPRKGDTISSSNVSDEKEMHSSEKSKMFLNSENGNRKQKSSQKSMSPEQNGTNHPPQKAHSSSGGKRKPKKRQISGSQGTCGSKEGRKTATAVNGCSKQVGDNNPNDINEEDGFAVQKGSSKFRDPYKEFFGEMDELGDHPVESPDIPGSVLKASEMAGDCADAFDGNVRENSRLKETCGMVNSRVSSEGVLNLAPLPENRALISDVAPADAADNWVCCDKCQKWRLLPLGTKVDSHSEWTCSMMSWLPGMNRCSFSEEETTKALQVLHNLPSDQKGHPIPMDSSKSGPTLTDVLQLSIDHHDSEPHGGKKKHGLKEVSGSSYQVGKKTIKSTSVSTSDYHHSNSADTIVDASGRKKKDKHQSLGSYSDGGFSNNSKIKRGNRNVHPTTTSKKMKIEAMSFENGDMTPAGGQSNEMLGPISSCYLPNRGAAEGQLSKHPGFAEREYYTNDSKHVAYKKSEPEIQKSIDIPSLEGKKFDDNNIAVKKRKMPDLQKPLNSAVTSKKMNFDDPHVTVKKATVSKSEEKKSSTNKGKVRAEKKLKTAKDQKLGSESESGTIHALNNLNESVPSIKKLTIAEPVGAATSSSSKVSGSSKIKSEFQEATGSPVNSVSSSPVRTSANLYSSGSRNHVRKSHSQNAHSNRDGWKPCSNAETDGGNDGLGSAQRNPTNGVSDHVGQKIPLPDLQDITSGENVKTQTSKSLKLPSDQLMGGHADTLQKGTQHISEARGVDGCLGYANDDTGDVNGHDFNRSCSRKLNEPSLLLKDKKHKFESDPDKGKVRLSESCSTQGQVPSCEDKTRDTKIKFQDKFSFSTDGADNDRNTKKFFGGSMATECIKSNDRLNPPDHDDLVVKGDAISRHHTRSTGQQDKEEECNEKGASRKMDIGKSEQTVSISGREKLHQLPSSVTKRNEIVNRCPRPCHGNVWDTSANTSDDAAALKEPVLDKRSDTPNKSVCNTSKHPMSNAHRGRNLDAPSPNRRDSSSQAATNVVKEAKDLKHLADRMKSAGSTAESTGLYFQAALKFLHGAALLESSNNENPKHGEVSQSKQIYSSTAKLCEFCAHEYEKLKDMAAAALAYKCMEVAYLKVVYSSRATASRDRHELQSALQIVSLGESPSSSASDLDNSNNPACGEKVVQVRGASSPQIMGNHVIAAKNRPNFTRLLNFAQDVNFAMEASRKSQIAYAAAMSTQQACVKEAISSIKRALDFNFHDVDGLLRLVRLAMEAISH